MSRARGICLTIMYLCAIMVVLNGCSRSGEYLCHKISGDRYLIVQDDQLTKTMKMTTDGVHYRYFHAAEMEECQ